MLVQLVDDDIGDGIPFQIDDDAGAFPLVRLIIDVRNSFDDLFIHQLSDPVTKCVAVDLVRHFRNHDLFSAAGFGIHLQFAAKYDTAPAEMHGCLDPFHAINDASGREIGRFDIDHQFFNGDVPVADISHTAVDHLG